MVIFVAGCAGTHRWESTGEYTDDTVITTKDKAKIFNNPGLKMLLINVESFKGIVQLSGFMNSAQASARAAEIASSERGVKSVKNSIVMK